MRCGAPSAAVGTPATDQPGNARYECCQRASSQGLYWTVLAWPPSDTLHCYEVMGTIRVTFPLDAMIGAWLDELGISHPSSLPPSRRPTPAEVIDAVASLPSCTHHVSRTSTSIDIQIDCGDAWSHVVLHEEAPAQESKTDLCAPRGDHVPCDISFYAGSEEVAIVLSRRLSERCGPLVLVPDTGVDPVVVVPARLDLDEG